MIMPLGVYDLPCSGCSNEPIDKIPLNRVIKTLDDYFAKNDLQSAQRHLLYWIEESKALCDKRTELSLCNEMIGLCRRTNEKSLALSMISRSVFLINFLSIDFTFSAGTIYLNAATTYKHFGEIENSLLFYNKTESIYEKVLTPHSYEYAALFNNKASVLEELGEYEEAEALLHHALGILESCNAHKIDQAISYVNLARLMFKWKGDLKVANQFLDKAWEVLTDNTISHDGAYAFVCAKAADEFAALNRIEEAIALSEVAKEIYEGN